MHDYRKARSLVIPEGAASAILLQIKNQVLLAVDALRRDLLKRLDDSRAPLEVRKLERAC